MPRPDRCAAAPARPRPLVREEAQAHGPADDGGAVATVAEAEHQLVPAPSQLLASKQGDHPAAPAPHLARTARGRLAVAHQPTRHLPGAPLRPVFGLAHRLDTVSLSGRSTSDRRAALADDHRDPATAAAAPAAPAPQRPPRLDGP